MFAERYAYGSIHGYGTLAHSPGLSPAECRLLECSAFGTPYDPTYSDSLLRQAAFWSRPLGSDRRAVTRVFPGALDDAGRPTLLFMTLVLPLVVWDGLLAADAMALARREELWRWDGQSPLTAVDIRGVRSSPPSLSGAVRSRVLALVSLVETNWARRRPVAVREEDYSAEEIAAVEQLLPPNVRQRYSAVHRSLNGDIGSTLASVARGVPAAFSSSSAPLSPYAELLAQYGTANVADLSLHYDSFGQPPVTFGVMETTELEMTPVAARSAPATSGALQLFPAVLVGLLTVTTLIGGVGGWLLRQATTLPPPPVVRWDSVAQEALAACTQTMQVQVDSLKKIKSNIENSKEFSASNEMVKAASAAYEHSKATLESRREVEQLIRSQSAEQGGRDADVAIERVRQHDAQLASSYRDWLADRRQLSALATFSANMKKCLEDELAEVRGFLESPKLEDHEPQQRAWKLIGAFEWLHKVNSSEFNWQRSTDDLRRQIDDRNQKAARSASESDIRSAEQAASEARARFEKLKTAMEALKSTPPDRETLIDKLGAAVAQDWPPEERASMDAIIAAVKVLKLEVKSDKIEKLPKTLAEIEDTLSRLKKEIKPDAKSALEKALSQCTAKLDAYRDLFQSIKDAVVAVP